MAQSFGVAILWIRKRRHGTSFHTAASKSFHSRYLWYHRYALFASQSLHRHQS